MKIARMNANNQRDNNTEVVYPKLSYQIVGVLFEVHTQLGGKYQEKYYQRAVAVGLKNARIKFKEQIPVDLEFSDNKIGKYLLDFLIEDKIVLELKAKPRFHPNDFRQVSAYLKAKSLRLGILANFRGEKLRFKRVLNSEARH